MRTSILLRWAGFVALAVVVSVGWTVQRSLQEANESTRWIGHTQEVLAQLETTLGVLAEAEHAILSAPSGDQTGASEALDHAIRDAEASVNRLAELIIDNPKQQRRISSLREATARSLTSLRQLAGARSRSEIWTREALNDERVNMDALRGAIQAMRTEENALLNQRTQSEKVAVGRLTWIVIGVALALLALVSASLALFARETNRRQRGADALLLAKTDLEAQVDARSSDLRDSSARLQSIIDSAVDGIIVIDAKGRIEAFNRGAEHLFGYPAVEVIGRNANILMPSPHHEDHDSYLARYLETGQAKIIGIGREVTGRRRDGTIFPLHLSVGEMSVGGERKFTGILHDLSARLRMEEQLREQASLVRLGEMAAVLAHEVKNPLAGIRGAIQVLGTRLPQGSRDGAIVNEVVARIDGLNALMKDLLLFARPPQPRPTLVELRALVSSTVEILGSDPALKDLEIQVDGSVPPIQADPELLKIAFGNLLVNGAHAMEGRGIIRVSLAVVGSRFQIVFRDNGPGIPPDVREKLFTPFFTTKARGSGLGLPTAKRLVEAHHGTISIACPPDGGTAVTVQLPAQAGVMATA